MSQNRVQAGVREGGQFATDPRSEPDLRLVSTQVVSDESVLDDIAAQLGASAQEWNVGDDLSAIADKIARTGRPHPGDAGDDWAKRFNEWKSANPRPAAPGPHAADWVALNALAQELAEKDEWRAEELGTVAGIIAATGRPHPGEARSLREFELAMAASRRARFLEADHPATTRAVAESAGVPVVHEALSIIHDREGVTDAQFATVTAEDVTRWHEQLIGPAADRMADQIQSTAPPKDSPYLDGEDEAWEHVRDAAQDAGLSSAAEVIWLRYESGDLNAADLESLTPELVGDMYERHLEPALDELEAELRGR